MSLAYSAVVGKKEEWGAMITNVAMLNQQHRYRAFTLDTLKALAPIFGYLRDPIAALLQAEWRVLNCRSWTTPPGATTGPNIWHEDGDLLKILKMMIYSTPTGNGHGGLELRI